MSPLAQQLLAKAKKLGTPPAASRKYEDYRPAIEHLLGEGWDRGAIIDRIISTKEKPIKKNSLEWWRWYNFIRRVD